MKKKSNPATELSNFLCKLLNTAGLHGITKWEAPWHPQGTRDSVDVAGSDGSGLRMLIEVERLRENPVSNVVKVWQWLSGGSVPKDVVLIHAFSKSFEESKAPRKERASFVGLRMIREFPTASYLQLPLNVSPKSGAKGIGGASKDHVKELVEEIRKVWKDHSKKA